MSACHYGMMSASFRQILHQPVQFNAPVSKTLSYPRPAQKSPLAIVSQRQLRLGGAIYIESKIPNRLSRRQQFGARLGLLTRQDRNEELSMIVHLVNP